MALWTCALDDHVVGMAALRLPGHISLLFVDAVHHRKGIAKKLVAEMANRAKVQDADALTVNASPYGAAAYRRMGFVDTGPEQTVNGLRFIPMRKPI